MKKLYFLLMAGYISSLHAQTPSYLWAKSFNGTGDKHGNAVALDPAGNVYSVGQFKDTVDFDPGSGQYKLESAGDYDIYISKLDQSGDFVWAHRAGSSNLDIATAVTVDRQDNIYVVGHFTDTIDADFGSGVSHLTSSGYLDVFVLKLDKNGNLIWARSMGGNEGDYATDVVVDDDLNVYSVGHYHSFADFDPGPATYTFYTGGQGPRAFVSKLDSLGNFVWAKELANPQTGPGVSSMRSVALDDAGNVYGTGYFRENIDFDPSVASHTLYSPGTNAYTVKLNSDGDFRWVRTLNSSGTSYGNAITVDESHDVILTGEYTGTVDFDHGPGASAGTGYRSLYVLKMDTAGSFIWARYTEEAQFSANNILAQAITNDGYRNIFISGSFQGVVDLDPDSASAFPLTSAGKTDVFVMKLNSDGQLQCAGQMGGAGEDEARGIAYDPSSYIYTTGSYGYGITGPSDFDPGPGTSNLYSEGLISSDIFISKLGACEGVFYSLKENVVSNVSAFPNPAGEEISVVSSSPISGIQIFNMSGQLIRDFEVSGNSTRIETRSLEKGIYFFTVHTVDGAGHLKIVKE